MNGVQVDERRSADQAIQLQGGGLVVVVKLTWLGQVKEMLAAPRGIDPRKADTEGVAFHPPAGSRAAWLERLRREHPELYAARHVAAAVLQGLIGVLGIGALLRALLPRFDLPAIPWPHLLDIPWPVIPWPDIDLPNFVVPDWIGELWSSVSWLVPIVIALFVAWSEIDKRRKRAKAAAQRAQAEEPARNR